MGIVQKINQTINTIKYKKLVKKAHKYFSEKKYKEAKETFEQAFSYGFLAIDYMRYACILCQLEEYSNAVEVINQILASNPPGFVQGWAHALLGDINFDLTNSEIAIEEYEKAIECEDFSLDAVCYLKLGTLYDNQESNLEDENVKKAYEYLKKAQELNNELLIATYEIGSILFRSERFEEALDCFLKVNEKDELKETDCDFQIGTCYEVLNNMDAAEKYYLEELKHKEPNPATLVTLGLLYMYSNKMDKAKEVFLKELKINEENYIAWYDLGCLYALEDDMKNANECFKVLKYKAPDLFNEINQDPELSEYIKSDYYKALLDE